MGKSGKMGSNAWTNFLKQRGDKACLENTIQKWKYTGITQYKNDDQGKTKTRNVYCGFFLGNGI